YRQTPRKNGCNPDHAGTAAGSSCTTFTLLTRSFQPSPATTSTTDANPIHWEAVSSAPSTKAPTIAAVAGKESSANVARAAGVARNPRKYSHSASNPGISASSSRPSALPQPTATGAPVVSSTTAAVGKP